jgi:serine protease AprX
MSDYKIFCPRADVGNLPEGVLVKKSYDAFSIISAPDELVNELRMRYPVEQLEPSPGSITQPDSSNFAALRDVASSRTREHVVRFKRPVEESWKEKLQESGVIVRRPIGNSALVISADDEQALARVGDLEEVEQVDPYAPVFRISERFLEGLDVAPTAEAIAEAHFKATTDSQNTASSTRDLVAPGVLMASFFTPEDREHAAEVLNKQGVRVTERVGERRLLLDVAAAPDVTEVLKTIAEQRGLRVLEEHSIKTISNNVARSLIGVGVISANPGGLSLTGKGEIIAVADTGLDTGNEATLHLDFKGRLRFIKSYPIATAYSTLVTNPGGDDGPADLYSGHGTHVSGSVLGNGEQAQALGLSPIAGMAPEAELVFQAIEQTPKWTSKAALSFLTQGKKAPVSGLFGIPPNLRDLFTDAYGQGARIHSNSWGGGKPGDYDLQCEDVDRFVWEHRDFLVVVAAGNAGRNSLPSSKAIDPMSVDSPGTAKNALTVGASENERSNEFSDTYGKRMPKSFPNPPFDADSMTDSVDDIAAFSSRGPCATGRRKPDVLAPGTFILSTRSSRIAPNNFSWAAYPPAKDHYMFMGGTSMATPLVAGSAALVREYLRKHKQIPKPSAALLKAVLIHSAQYLKYRFPHPSSAAPADNEQGWGRIQLGNVLSPAPPNNIIFRDEAGGLSTGDEDRITVEITDTSVPLRVTLVYTDFPSDMSANGALVNNLNLLVLSPGGKFYLGNDFKQQGTPDKVNNVEGVFVTSPETGKWTIRVVASEVLEGKQQFALVASGGGLSLV